MLLMSVRMRLTSVITAFALVGIVCSPTYGQGTMATLSGTVMDESGARVPGAGITVLNIATAARREATTNAEGFFTLQLLPPGKYQLTARRDGFTPFQVPELILNVNDQVSLTIRLIVSQVAEEVTVEANPFRIKTSAEVSTVVDRQFVENLPMNGRSFQSLIYLTPGITVAKANFREPGQFSVNGQRTNTNYFMVDGVSANSGTNATFPLGAYFGGSVPALSASGTTSSLVSVDAMQEFRIQTSTFAPEFGRTPGAQVSIVTRSGTNEFHGTVFDYLRNESMDANDWFANRDGLAQAALRQNDFGGVVGGPVVRDRTFFFFSYEGLRLTQPRVAQLTVPTLATRQATPAALQPFVNAFPLPNREDFGNGFGRFVASYSDPTDLDSTSIRLDQRFGSGLTLFGRYNHAPSQKDSLWDGGIRPTRRLTIMHNDALTLGMTQILGPRLLHDLRVNYSRGEGSSVSSHMEGGGLVPVPDSALPPHWQPGNSLFAFTTAIPGSTVLVSAGKNVENIQRQINLVDGLTWSAGVHQWKFGVDYRLLLPSTSPRGYDFLISISGLPNLFAGRANTFMVSARDEVDLQTSNFSAFAQDTWRLNSRLTLTYGLRWDLNPPPKARHGRELLAVNGLRDRAALDYAPPGTPLFETSYTNFAPRVGVSYLVSRSPGAELMVRAGGGIFFDLGAGSTSDTASSFPHQRSRVVPNAIYSPALDTSPPPFTMNPPYGSPFVIDPSVASPRTYQWSVGLERALGKSQTVSVAYVGAAGRDLLRGEFYFAPNPRFTSVFFNRSTAESDHHSLQVQFQRRLSGGLQAMASYTWAHTTDIASAEAAGVGVASSFNLDPELERGDAAYDVRHTVSGALTYNVPAPWGSALARALAGGWSIDTIFRAASGTPIDIVSSRDIGFGPLLFRPDRVPDVPFWIDNPSAPGGRVINRAAFILPTERRQGNLPRNAVRGFPSWQLDLALHRDVRLRGAVRMQVRGEVFNILNHPNFADPSGRLTDALFGVSAQMLGRSLTDGGAASLNNLYQIGGPRSVQLGLKLMF